MARFIEEFYYGNIDPQARSTKQNKTVQKEMAVLACAFTASFLAQTVLKVSPSASGKNPSRRTATSFHAPRETM